MKHFIFFIFIYTSLTGQVKPDVNLYYKPIKNGYSILADNHEFCPVSVVLRLDLNNLKTTNHSKNTFIIQARKDSIKLTDLVAIRQGKYGFKFNYNIYRGNINKVTYDANYAYALPFKKGFSALVGQGYNGNFSHQNINAIDFNMPVGTPITTIRPGKVIAVVDSFNKHGVSPYFKSFSNYIIIMHSDGTFAKYAHLKFKSAEVKPGDIVAVGKEIALGGNTGWTTGPHLHLEVYLPKAGKAQTLKTKFKVGDGKLSSFLKEKEVYKKAY